MPRKQQKSKTHICTYCGGVHPKGKKQKEVRRKEGWSCKSIAIRRRKKQSLDAPEERKFDQQQRTAKNTVKKNRRTIAKTEQQAIIQERLNRWRSLSPEKQLAELDKRLGKNMGAKKQRAAIQKRIEEKNTKPKKAKKSQS